MAASSLPDKLRTRTGVAVVLGVVALFAALVYLPTISYDLVWDDNLLITSNQLFARSGPADFFTRPFWAGSPDPVEGSAASYYRPLVSLSFWADSRLHRMNPRGFHATNILLNALAAVALALVLWELLHSGVWALLGGLLFAAHSSHVESVAFVSGRTDVMLGLFSLIAAFAVLRALRKRATRWWLLAVPAFCLALLSKEAALLFPVLVLLAPSLTGTRFAPRQFLLFGITSLCAAGYLVLRSTVTGPLFGGTAMTMPTVARIINSANTIGIYVQMFFAPFIHRAKMPADPLFWGLTPSVLAALLFVVSTPLVALRRRYWVVLWGYTWTIVFLLPVANLVPIGPQAAERLLYLPSAGMVMIVITLFARSLNARPLLRQLAAVVLLAGAALLATDSMARSRVWQNETTLFSAMVHEAPNAPSPYAGLADAIAASNPDSAITLYNRALALDQGYVRAYINSAILLSRKGDHRRAVHNLRIATELRPGSVQALNNLGLAFLAAGRPDSALAAFDRGLAVSPASAELHLNRAAAFTALDRKSEAVTDLRRAVALDSGLAGARVALAARFIDACQPDSARRILSGLKTGGRPAARELNRLGTLLVTQGDTAAAETCYHAAVRSDSTDIPALYNAALILAARGDTAAALVIAERARRLRPDLAAINELCARLARSR